MAKTVRAAAEDSRFQQGDFVVAMLGARMHYAVPRILHDSGLLMHLFTDLCGAKGVPRTLSALPKELLPNTIRRVVERIPQGVPPSKITAFTGFGLHYALRIARAASPSELARAFLWGGKEFCRLVEKKWPPGVRALFAYNSAALELLCHARDRGVYSVMEQTIAPKRLEHRLLAEEAALHPGWENMSRYDIVAEEYTAREEAEWNRADLIVCGSEFVKDGIRACGGPVGRVAVVPYGVDTPRSLREPRETHGPLRVLTVGAVGLRKGSPYVLDAARALQGRAIFRMVGSVSVGPSVERSLREFVEIVGAVPRGEVACHYAWADVFLLPSICEGSATVCYEAVASGLPVIATPNTGSPIRDGSDGFVVPIRDAEAIAERVDRLANRPDLLASMSKNALERASEFTVQRYGERFLVALGSSARTDS